jgi:hypothetical protein
VEVGHEIENENEIENEVEKVAGTMIEAAMTVTADVHMSPP